MTSQPGRSRSSAVAVVVDDWPGTFHIPDGTERRLEPGPRWLVPVGGVLGLLLAALVLRSDATPGIVWLVCGPAFLACVGAVGLALGGARGRTAAIACAATAWAPAAAAVLGRGRLDVLWATAVLVGGALGQVAAAERARIHATRDRDSVIAARGGTRTDGWVVSVAGPPWATDLRVEPADGGDEPWTATHTDWRAVRPRAGHPVGIWRGEPTGAVVLLPRRPH